MVALSEVHDSVGRSLTNVLKNSLSSVDLIGQCNSTLTALYKGAQGIRVEDITIKDDSVWLYLSDKTEYLPKHTLVLKWNMEIVDDDRELTETSSDDVEASDSACRYCGCRPCRDDCLSYGLIL